MTNESVLIKSSTIFFRERIIEYCLPSSDGPLISCSVKEFVQEVAARSSAPGGGSVSALIAAMVKIEPLFNTSYFRGVNKGGGGNCPPDFFRIEGALLLAPPFLGSY